MFFQMRICPWQNECMCCILKSMLLGRCKRHPKKDNFRKIYFFYCANVKWVWEVQMQWATILLQEIPLPPKKYVFTMPPSSESERCRRRWATDPTSPHPTFANCTQLALYTLNSWEKLGGKLFEFLFLLCRMYAAADLVLIWVLWPSLFLGGVAFLWPLHDRQHGGIVELRSG